MYKTEAEIADLTLLEYGQRSLRSSETNKEEQVKEILPVKDAENELVTTNALKGIMNIDVLSAASEQYLQLKDTDSMV